jgi:acetate kinase
MRILVLNGGSSSIKFSLYENAPNADPKLVEDGEFSNIGTPEQTLEAGGKTLPTTSAEPIQQVLDAIPSDELVDAVGYRVVHPGPRIHDHARITPQLLDDLQHAVAFAPLHDPVILEIIHAGMARYPSLQHYACFDTIFHQTMPPEATTYPIPLAFEGQGVRRYGFHGLSCESVVYQLRATPGLPFPNRLLIAHLGSGCSVTALVEGKSVDNSMGLTPTGGVVMGTRPGDLDPGLIFYLLRQPGATIDSVEHMLNHDAGLKALGGVNDMKELRESAVRDAKVGLAVDVFVQSIRRTLGGMVALHGIDALVFTGGIGEHDPKTRWALGNGLRGTGLEEPQIDFAANELPAHALTTKGLRKISDEDALYEVFVVPAEEDLMIALHVQRMAQRMASNGL